MKPRQCRRLLPLLFVALAGALPGLHAEAQGPFLADEPALQGFADGRAMTLIPSRGGARIETAEGGRTEIALPQGAYPSSIRPLARGWALALDVPDGEDGSGRRHLTIVRGGPGAKRETLPEPGDKTAGERLSPILLVDGGRIAGLAWLEGDAPRGLAVRAAAWDGKAWSAPQWVSHPGPGSQLALTGVVLKDGSWLLAWSAFDGQDDEVVWSRRTPPSGRDSASWSRPASISIPNSVPDITPALTATPDGGARIAWDRFSPAAPSGYRLLTARFDGSSWLQQTEIAGPGSLYPSFVEDPRGEPALLYLEAQMEGRPRAWTLSTLDAQGRIAKRAAVSSTLERPAVAFETDGSLRLRWPLAGRDEKAELKPVAKSERVP